MNMKSYRSYEYILFRRKIRDISTNIVPFFLQIKYNIENIYYSLILRKIMFSDKRIFVKRILYVLMCSIGRCVLHKICVN